MTHRVSETHGFALVENGELVRLFCYDENEIQNMGEPLPEEIELGYKLPTNFEEAGDEKFTQVNEDVIMTLALLQVGIDVEKYPYKDVKLGKRFEYSGEIAADPYPDEDREIPEEVWKLPEVQRFMNCTSVDERIQMVEEVRDILTHPILDAFGEIAVGKASYDRLSERIEEYLCILRTARTFSPKSCVETVMSKEEFLEKINKGTYIFKGITFKHFTIENMKCDTLTFINCVFLDMKLINNEIDRLECKECSFIKSEICGKSKTTCIILEKTRFNYCRIHDLEVNGEQNNTEWKSCSFEYCAFDDIKLCADISVIDGWFWSCKGKQLEFVIRQLFSNSLSGGKFEDVKICADVTDNKLEDVEIQGLEKIDTERELDWSLNRFKNCMINGEKKEKSLLEVQQEMKRKENSYEYL